MIPAGHLPWFHHKLAIVRRRLAAILGRRCLRGPHSHLLLLRLALISHLELGHC